MDEGTVLLRDGSGNNSIEIMGGMRSGSSGWQLSGDEAEAHEGAWLTSSSSMELKQCRDPPSAGCHGSSGNGLLESRSGLYNFITMENWESAPSMRTWTGHPRWGSFEE